MGVEVGMEVVGVVVALGARESTDGANGDRVCG